MKRILISLASLTLFVQFSFGQIAPNFTVTDSDGKVHKLYEDYLDQGKTVVIDIFFVGCPPCADIAPHTQQLYEDWGEGEFDVQFMELSNKTGDTNAEVADWKDQLGTTYPGVGNDGGAFSTLTPYLAGDFGPFFGVPTFVVIAPDRTVVFDVSGPGISGKIEALNNAIIATGAQGEGDMVVPTLYEFVITDAFGNPVDDIKIELTSNNQIGASYDIFASNGDILSVQNFDDDFPDLTTPTFFFSKQQNILQEKITTSDIITILKHIIGVEALPNDDLIKAADANNDGKVTSIDLITLQKIVLGIWSEYPNEGTSWKFVPDQIPAELNPGVKTTIEIKALRTGDMNNF